MEKLNRAQKFSILGPQNLRSREGPGPPGLRAPPWIRTCHEMFVLKILFPTVIYERCQLVEGLDGELAALKNFWRRRQIEAYGFQCI